MPEPVNEPPLTIHYFLVDVKQSMLETIVPKNDSDAVMVVLGEHRGQVSGWHHFHDWLKWSFVRLVDETRANVWIFLLSFFKVGRILQRDRDRSKALVQLDRYEEEVFNLDYDTICHYIGAVDNWVLVPFPYQCLHFSKPILQ